MKLQDIDIASYSENLCVFGALHCAPGDLNDDIQTLVLLGPREPGFWAHFTASPEYRDRLDDPLDRWSSRVISDLAKTLNAKAYFPFGGPPYQPFIQWATKSGRAFISPVGLLVHDVAGLMVSYRGALGFREQLDLPEISENPCIKCENKPCITACPVDALRPENYDVVACKTDLDQPENHCMSKGCATRRACPISQSYGRTEEQSAFHMEAFK